MRRNYQLALGCGIWWLLVGIAMFAQSIQSSITGIVTDPQGAIVVDARVAATEVATGVRRERTTNSSGLYSFQDLLPGTYVVNVSKAGFRQVTSDNIVVVANAMNRFDVRLEVGGANQEVLVVKATPPTLVTDSAEIGDLQVGEDAVKQPIQRSEFLLMGLSGGNVVEGSGIALGGQRAAYQNLTIDGITTMNNNFGGSSGAMSTEQSFESVAEVKMIQSNGEAEQPGFAGLITTTKGGTNQLHGSAFYTTDNSALEAHPPGTTLFFKGPQIHWYGGSLGGPVWIPKVYHGRNKTFFFVTWEHRTFPAAAGDARLATANLPTLAFRGETNANGDADFSSLLPKIQLVDPFNNNAPFPGNIIPHNRLSSASLALQNNYYPKPTIGNPNSYVSNYQVLQTSPEHLDREDVRIDHNFSDHDSISGRITYQDDSQPTNYDGQTLFFLHSRGADETNAYIAETHTFSPALVNEFRVGYSRDNRNFIPSQDGNAALQKIGLNLAAAVPAGTKGFPNISFSPSGDTGSGIDGFFELGSSVELGQEYSLLDNVTWQRGTHTIKGGILVRNGRPQNSAGNFADQFGDFTFNGFATGFPYADFLLGVPFSISQNTNIPNVYVRRTDTGLFVQDSWHATPKLTLNYGLRWEYYKPPTDINDRRVNFDPATGNIVVANKQTLSLFNPTLPTMLVNNAEIGKYPGLSLLDSRKTDFAPRIGIAYLLPKQMVIRGGYGIYFGPLTQAVQDSFENSGLFGTNLAAASNSFTNNVPAFQFPSPFAGITSGGGSTCTTGCSIVVSGTDPHLKTPTTQEWNVTVERDLGRSMVARVGYRGFMTTQLPVVDDLIIPQITTNSPLYPFYGHVNWTHDGAIQKMNALDLTLDRKFTSGLTFRFSYTLAKNISDINDNGEHGSAQDPYNRAADMGNVSYVPRQRLVNNLVWDIPVGRGKRFAGDMPRRLDYVVGGWETTIINVFQSGSFLTPVWNGDGSLLVNEGISLRPNCSGSLSAPHQSRQQWFNTAAFSAPAPGTYGNCGVGILTGPGMIGFNLGLGKAFKVNEKLTLKFDANMMNAFNHPNPGNPDTNFSDLGNGFGAIPFGRFNSGGNTFSPSATNINGERHIWLGLRLDF